MSAFEKNLKKHLEEKIELIQMLYKRDYYPWVIGYSGGKDSTAVLQLIWLAISKLPKEERTREIHTISTDTRVENPVVTAWVSSSVQKINWAAERTGMPIKAHELKPEIKNTFWVNLIGRGYPSPRQGFRWCTDRLKIKPSSSFIMNHIQEHGECLLLMGTRKAESSTRKRSMEKFRELSDHEIFSVNGDMINSYTWSPIEEWTTPDVWEFLMSIPNPWGWDNKQLMSMYRGATEDNECPLVVDRSTPSCGNSRFGCWVCTMVSQDKSMEAMINNDVDKEWMSPLLEIREVLSNQEDDHLRDYKRSDGTLHVFNGKTTRGPYHQEARKMWLRIVLEAQKEMRENAPESLRNIEIISKEELDEIRSIWVYEKKEIEDILPLVFEEVNGEKFPSSHGKIQLPFNPDDLSLLRKICEEHDEEGKGDLLYRACRDLLYIESRYRTKRNRKGIIQEIDGYLSQNSFVNENDAVQIISKRALRQELLGTGLDGEEL